ncbi:MAG: winged helix-turn-helix domain-containing protein [Firmicutes bacterium]|nr:winged helix-turn-helix domain-containing protein [Bacillota bacterium]
MMYPKYKDTYAPLLQEIARRGGCCRPSARVNGLTVYEELAQYFQLSPEALHRQFTVTAGPNQHRMQWLWPYRVRWAKDQLKRLGLIASPARGIWVLTDRGWQAVRRLNDNNAR